MVVKSIINVRRSSICWRGRRELIPDVRKPETAYNVIVGGELFTDYPITSQTCHAKPKTQINRRRTLPASFPLVDAHRKKPFGDFPKSQDAVALQQIRSVALYL